MNQFGRLIGIDVGTKKVGLARTDLLRTSANAVGTFSPDDSLKEIEKMANEEYPVTGFVVGWPLTPDGEEADATRMVDRYLKRLNKAFPDIPVHLIDERYSSLTAVKNMIEAGVPRGKRRERGRIDMAAAAFLLQQYIESNPEN